MNVESDWLNLGEAAELLGVHPSTVRAWADRGEIPVQRTPGGHRRFRQADLEAHANRQRATRPAGAGRQHWLLGWVHPHGGTAQFAAGLAVWAAYWAGPSAGRGG